MPPGKYGSIRTARGLFLVHRHLPKKTVGEGRPPCRPRALENQITIQEVPRADDPARRSRIGSGPGLCIKQGMCGGLSQSALSYRSLMITFCRKSRPIINGRLFLSISPITGLGLCELRELCEKLILSLVWAVLLHKAGGVFTPRPCGKTASRIGFF